MSLDHVLFWKCIHVIVGSRGVESLKGQFENIKGEIKEPRSGDILDIEGSDDYWRTALKMKGFSFIKTSAEQVNIVHIKREK